ncbi:hypothetical protein ACFZDJ_19130 [Streptomyces sp. NPDC007896]|uniref:hypothetical protein n=1 Tax=Streptomyces sp. NPDC007896 TaxID=3364784 RepID=UPI0036F0B9B2
MAQVLAHHDLPAVGGFTPLLLHVPGHDPLPEAEQLLESHAASKAEVLVLSAVTGQDGYDSRPELDADGWRLLLSNLDRARETWMSRPSSSTAARAGTTAGRSWNRTPS